VTVGGVKASTLRAGGSSTRPFILVKVILMKKDSPSAAILHRCRELILLANVQLNHFPRHEKYGRSKTADAVSTLSVFERGGERASFVVVQCIGFLNPCKVEMF
jgi:hypothetical protein